MFVDGVRTIRPTPAERAALTAAGIVDPLMQGYTAWRRSLILVALPVTLLSGALALWDLVSNTQTDELSTVGALALVVPSLAVLVLTVATVLAAITWRSPHASARILQTGWAISLFAPVLVAVIPFQWLLDGDATAGLAPEAEVILRVYVSVAYTINLLPTLLSFPSGVVRGGARVKSLLPASTISGWVLVIFAPVYAVFFVVALILVEQLAGNVVLLTGIVLLALSPFLHVFAARLYVAPLTTQAELRRLDGVQRRAGLVSLGGATLIVIWALTTKFVDAPIVGSVANGAFLDHQTALLRACELVARVLITTAVFSHLLLQITEASWRQDRGFADLDAYAHHERQMAQVERALGATGDRVG